MNFTNATLITQLVLVNASIRKRLNVLKFQNTAIINNARLCFRPPVFVKLIIFFVEKRYRVTWTRIKLLKNHVSGDAAFVVLSVISEK